ncbi:protein DEHYDRATION-INDUCED 19 homolog 6-like [Manihot esculenta]|uniref:Uncharacterized protein n=1 Tax=Manihot esculenta TaxID=3983 RepID=A0ACB7HB19_MANES|nr:protein DEHYDRATION-INDUCED 19 homolog 6-like [Manihot esculenta]KAG8649632.1 hypothetical protein MANES_08G113600v8 [Manihot esculenta]
MDLKHVWQMLQQHESLAFTFLQAKYIPTSSILKKASLAFVWLNASTSLTTAYMQQTKRSQKGGHYSTLALLRKELREGNLQSLFERSSCIFSSFNTAPDPLLSSFILPMADDFASVQHSFSDETSSAKKSFNENVLERNMMSPLSIKDQEDKAKGLNLFKGWLLSAILDDIL